MIRKLTHGPRFLVNKINEIIDYLNRQTGIRGDGFINVNNSSEMPTVRLDINKLRTRIGRQLGGGGGGSSGLIRSASVASVGNSWIKAYLNTWKYDTNQLKYVWQLDTEKPITVWCDRFHLGVNDINSGEVWPEYKAGDTLWVIRDLDSCWYPVVPFYDRTVCPGETI